MKLRNALTFGLIALGTFFGSGIAKAQTQAQVLQKLYGNDVPGGNTSAALSMSFWTPYQVSGSTFSGTSVALSAQVAFSSGQDLVLGTTTAGGGNGQIIGAVTGKTTLGPGGSFNNSGASTYKFVGSGSSAFFTNTSGPGGTPIGAFTFHPANDPFAFTVSSLQTPGTIQDGESISDYNAAHGTNYPTWAAAVAAQTTSTVTSTNSSDMQAFLIDGQYVLMWNLSGNGSDANGGNYTGLVLDVTGVKNPEPTSLALMGFGALGLLGYKIRRRGKPSQTPAVS